MAIKAENVQWTVLAWQEFEYWLDTDKQQVKKIRQLIKDCLRSGYEGIGKPEALREDKQGLWSRRIDQEHRLIYYFEGERLIIVSCRFHYDN
ncbi:MAG: Txe/YoeB family addiction module toxin [Streptococcaceae bacterium]|jgi:toxin YoeB|nr:Txe/YoeB family addiction module toxin [Streptococcaceae bacterium]